MFFEEPTATHVIAHISDTHLLGGNRKLFSRVDVKRNLTDLLERLRATDLKFDALVFTGDLADVAEPEAYRWIRGQVEPVAAELGARVIWVMGNHDEREPYARELFDEESDGSPRDRVYDVNGLRVIALDSTVPGYHHGELDDSQLEWLAAELATPAAHGTILALHHPPIRSHNPLVRMIELFHQDRLDKVVRGSDVRSILGGHLHYSTFGMFAGIPVAVASATCYTVDMGMSKDFLMTAVDGGQSIQLVHVYDDTVVHAVVPVDEFPQLTAYPSALRAMAATMTEEQIIEMVSSKNSKFNQAESKTSAGEF
ncbi:MAG: phosphodiesterase [Microbacteriaceae bacterium]